MLNFWKQLEDTAGQDGSFVWIIVAFLGSSAGLFILAPSERMRLRAAISLFALSFFGLLAATWIGSAGFANIGIFITVRCIALLLEAVAVINICGVFAFIVIFPVLRLDVPRIIQDLLVGLAYIIAALMLLSHSGIDVSGIVATSAVITAVIGFSLQDTLGNIMGGVALQMERTINVGDWIRVNDIEGRVKEIRWRQTSIETRDWDTVVIPNSLLMKGKLTLLGRRTASPTQRRRWVMFNVDFRYSPTDVIHTVENALLAEPISNVAQTPKPHCIVTEFKDSYITYAARYWLTDLSAPDPTDSVVRTLIFSALRRSGTPLSIPAQALFVTEDDASNRERKKAADFQKKLESIQELSLFCSLTDEERNQLALNLKLAPFVEGEALTKQGAQAHWLYIIIEGEAEVHITTDGKIQHIATLHRGDFFGEMGMMTGEPRTATVVARTDVTCYRLGKKDFEEILKQRPEIADSIASTLAHRRMELESIRENLSEEARRERLSHNHGDFLDRIRTFFHLDS